MPSDERLLEWIGLVYDAALSPPLWPAFLEKLAEVIGCEAARSDPQWIDRQLREPSAFHENLEGAGQWMLALEPHIRRALEIRRREQTGLAARAVLEALPMGVVYIGPDLLPLWWNPYAEDVFQDNDGIRIGAKGFEIARHRERESFLRLITDACSSSPHALQGGGGLSISRTSHKRPYTVLVSPLRNQAPEMAAVLLTDPERVLTPNPERLVRQFKLTPAEARLAAELADGKTVEAAAAVLAIRVATARTHLRHILQKTATARQSELVRLLLNTPNLLHRK